MCAIFEDERFHLFPPPGSSIEREVIFAAKLIDSGEPVGFAIVRRSDRSLQVFLDAGISEERAAAYVEDIRK
jgi:hypothetical protein